MLTCEAYWLAWGTREPELANRARHLLHSVCRHLDSGETLTRGEQFLLPFHVAGRGIRSAPLHMVEVFTRDLRDRIVAHREPNLCAVSGIKVVGRSRASHLGCNPTRLKGIGENVWPAARHRERQKHIVQLGIRVGLLSAPRALLPREIL